MLPAITMYSNHSIIPVRPLTCRYRFAAISILLIDTPAVRIYLIAEYYMSKACDIYSYSAKRVLHDHFCCSKFIQQNERQCLLQFSN